MRKMRMRNRRRRICRARAAFSPYINKKGERRGRR